jgi:hypothetical protein
MLLELADHDGDVDRAVHLLAQREHPQYGAIVDRLRAPAAPRMRWHGSIVQLPMDESPATVVETHIG